MREGEQIITSGGYLLFFSRPLRGLGLTFVAIPAINRWAIFSRPLSRTLMG